MPAYRLILLGMTLFIYSCAKQRLFKEYQQKGHRTEGNEIILISSYGCGFSALAKKGLHSLENGNTSLVIIEQYSHPVDSLKIIDASQFKSFKFKFFPQIIVRQKNGEVKYYRGWDKRTFNNIKKTLQP